MACNSVQHVMTPGRSYMLVTIAKKTVDLSIFRKTLLHAHFSKDGWSQSVFEVIQQVKDQIHHFNQMDAQNSTVKIDCPALHLFSEFALNECIKNSLDARATELTISVYLDNQTVFVMIHDDGPHKSDHMTVCYDEYSYLDAFKQGSNKHGHPDMFLGGKGLGLALSAQYLKLLAKSGALLAGDRANHCMGFVVTLSSENESVKSTWHDYLPEFEAYYRSVINALPSVAAEAKRVDFSHEEHELVERITERTEIHRVQAENYFCLFSLGSGKSEDNSKGEQEETDINPLSP